MEQSKIIEEIVELLKDKSISYEELFENYFKTKDTKPEELSTSLKELRDKSFVYYDEPLDYKRVIVLTSLGEEMIKKYKTFKAYRTSLSPTKYDEVIRWGKNNWFVLSGVGLVTALTIAVGIKTNWFSLFPNSTSISSVNSGQSKDTSSSKIALLSLGNSKNSGTSMSIVATQNSPTVATTPSMASQQQNNLPPRIDFRLDAHTYFNFKENLNARQGVENNDNQILTPENTINLKGDPGSGNIDNGAVSLRMNTPPESKTFMEYTIDISDLITLKAGQGPGKGIICHIKRLIILTFTNISEKWKLTIAPSPKSTAITGYSYQIYNSDESHIFNFERNNAIVPFTMTIDKPCVYLIDVFYKQNNRTDNNDADDYFQWGNVGGGNSDITNEYLSVFNLTFQKQTSAPSSVGSVQQNNTATFCSFP
jgi:hypothetical protein